MIFRLVRNNRRGMKKAECQLNFMDGITGSK